MSDVKVWRPGPRRDQSVDAPLVLTAQSLRQAVCRVTNCARMICNLRYRPQRSRTDVLFAPCLVTRFPRNSLVSPVEFRHFPWDFPRVSFLRSTNLIYQMFKNWTSQKSALCKDQLIVFKFHCFTAHFVDNVPGSGRVFWAPYETHTNTVDGSQSVMLLKQAVRVVTTVILSVLTRRCVIHMLDTVLWYIYFLMYFWPCIIV